ncbi:MAG: hypothetical protein ABIQ97_05535 [Lysobacteraceae bacterium]
MHFLLVGGLIDNSELDVETNHAPVHYPEDGGSGTQRYRLHAVGSNQDTAIYAVYAAPEMEADDVDAVVVERDYARRFGAPANACDTI